MRRANALELLLAATHNKEMGEIPSKMHRVLILASLVLFPIFAQADSLAQRDYQIAKSLFDSGKETEALVSLSDFLRRHTGDLLADDAQFLMGEIYFRRRQFPEAIIEFRKVARYQKGDRLADAYLRVGESQQKLGNYRAALIEFEAVRRRFAKGEDHDRAELLIEGLMKSGNQK